MKSISLLVVLLIAVFVVSCNMFGPYGARNPEAYGAEAVILEGKLKLRESNFVEALALFNRAIQMDNSKSEAYFYRGKCMLRMAGVDITQVWNEINKKDAAKKEVPFLYPITSESAITRTTSRLGPNGVAVNVIDSVFLERKKIYDIVCQTIKNLDTIIYRYHYMDGAVQRDQYESDYLIESSIKTVLGAIDMNRNDSLDFISTAAPGNEQKTFKILCRDLANLDSMNLDSLKFISTDPNDLNGRLLDMALMVGRSDTSYNNFQADLDAGAAQTNKINTSMASGIGEMLANFKTIIPYYYYNDCADNDGNWYDTDGDGKVDRMIWIDWDGDGLIDINAPGISPHDHIGSYQQRYRDNTPSTRGNYNSIDTPGASYSRYQYVGPYTHEFIFGDWGVDEEMMDGDDNTFDGLTDEDSRIVDDTLDDDGDFFSTSGVARPVKMAWIDNNSNRFVDISSYTLVMQPKAKTVFAIAAFLNTPAVNDRYAANPADTFAALKNLTIASNHNPVRLGGEFTAGDYGIDEEWYDGIDNDGDGLIDEDVGIANIPESQRSALITALNNPAYHARLHSYWSRIQDYWKSVRGN